MAEILSSVELRRFLSLSLSEGNKEEEGAPRTLEANGFPTSRRASFGRQILFKLHAQHATTVLDLNAD